MVSRYLVDGINIGGVIVSIIGVMCVAKGALGERRGAILRAGVIILFLGLLLLFELANLHFLPVNFDLDLTTGTIAVSVNKAANIFGTLLVVLLAATTALVGGRLLAKSDWTEKQFQVTGLTLTLLGLATLFVSPILDLLNIKVV